MFRVRRTSRSTSASAREEALQSQDVVLHRPQASMPEASEPPFRSISMLSTRAALHYTRTHTHTFLSRCLPPSLPFPSSLRLAVSLSTSLAPLLDSGSTWTSKFGAQGAHPCAHGRLPALSRSQEGRGGAWAWKGPQEETPPLFLSLGRSPAKPKLL